MFSVENRVQVNWTNGISVP